MYEHLFYKADSLALEDKISDCILLNILGR
jgi:hypothetical protein